MKTYNAAQVLLNRWENLYTEDEDGTILITKMYKVGSMGNVRIGYEFKSAYYLIQGTLGRSGDKLIFGSGGVQILRGNEILYTESDIYRNSSMSDWRAYYSLIMERDEVVRHHVRFIDKGDELILEIIPDQELADYDDV